MDDGQPVAVLEEMLAVKGEHLLRTAVLLAGSHADGTDLPAADGTGDVPVTEERTQFRWLAPTTANLAHLTVPVPPGFREVSAQG